MATKHLKKEDFIKKIFNYETEKEWNYLGEKPCIIDFYASWCGPCKTLSPILEELSNEYDSIDIYKINTEEEQELSQVFNIRSIPTMLFISKNGEPQLIQGALPKNKLKEAIEEILK